LQVLLFRAVKLSNHTFLRGVRVMVWGREKGRGREGEGGGEVKGGRGEGGRGEMGRGGEGKRGRGGHFVMQDCGTASLDQQ